MNTKHPDPVRQEINKIYLADEQICIRELLAGLGDYQANAIHDQAAYLVKRVRENSGQQSLVESFLHEYGLNSSEGIILMEMAEALLRIPDNAIQDAFLQEKLTQAGWSEHIQHSDSTLVNLVTQALSLTGRLEKHLSQPAWTQSPERIISRLGAPVIRSAMKQAMLKLASQFVLAETINKALRKNRTKAKTLYSFDCLGEAALTTADAERYFQAYKEAISALARQQTDDHLFARHGISVKLSALCPRYEPFQWESALPELTAKLGYLARQAKAANINLTVDAEESERLQLSLDIFEQVMTREGLEDWNGLGLAVQAYQKRSLPVLRWLQSLAEQLQRTIPVRLVKGAYWDSEIKRAQENGLSNYPVYTHKTATDVSYLTCASFLLSRPQCFYPQFATHNAHTVAAILVMRKSGQPMEFQRLHGMGERLYYQVTRLSAATRCRIYAPVGSYQDLLSYLVRRLLENGANTSFINQVEDPDIDLETLVADPVKCLQETKEEYREQLPLPVYLYGKTRSNSLGINLPDTQERTAVETELERLKQMTWQVAPLVDGVNCSGEEHTVFNPARAKEVVGKVKHSSSDTLLQALDSAHKAYCQWRLSDVRLRASYLVKMSELLEKNRLELVSLCVREGGRTIRDALAEVREAVDFCRYYAHCAQIDYGLPEQMPGPTGEDNRLYHYGRGVFVCISPWNFPIAIFTGQIAAALVTGNTVLAKPANQTPLTAQRCIKLFHQAGIPVNVLHCLPGDGVDIGRTLLSDRRVAGVAFTGSTATARHINQQLAGDLPNIVPFIAETGGQNVMIADSSAHIEQLIIDVLQSAFNSAGQRCSALRALYIQQDMADNFLNRLQGAMSHLKIGDPGLLSTDIGPVIDGQAAAKLHAHIDTMHRQAKLLFQAGLNSGHRQGHFFPPALVELSSLTQLEHEVFGPILHIIRYQAGDLDTIIKDINATGYGLTLGIQSRIQGTVQHIREQARVGNVYVNRNMIGAVVGVQPFGGMNLSGTGPKAGGPDYLQRFTVEQTLTVNTSAIGGNATLMARDLR